MRFLRLTFLAAFSLGFSFARAEVKMEPLFGDHMVLQQDAKLPVWGWADTGEDITVTIGSSTAKTKAGTDGKWRVDLKPLPTNSQPQVLTVQGKNTLKFEDVLVGDIWICSGQSNMEFGAYADNRAQAELAKPIDSTIRIFWVVKAGSLNPEEHLPTTPPERPAYGKWLVCTPDNLKQAGSWDGFSGVGFYFARELQATTKRPVGMIGAYWGGTGAQAWTSLPALQQNPALAHYAENLKTLSPDQLSGLPVNWATFDVAARKWDQEYGDKYYAPWRDAVTKARLAGLPTPPMPPPPPGAPPKPRNPGNLSVPTVLFNAMINPLIPYAIKGVIWYQGEANAGGGEEYATLFPTMITDWRTRWGQGDFPFLFVQLACWGTNETDAFARIREAQLKTLSLPNTGMAVAIDIGNPADIHPKDKIDVGARLALVARHVAYGEKDLVSSGPLYDSMKVEGNKIRISFKELGGGLTLGVPPWTPSGTPVPPPTKLTSFQIAGDDKKWFPADAIIDGSTVVVSSAQVPAPVAVRYAFQQSPDPVGDLYNKEGLPASPFRTDDWK